MPAFTRQEYAARMAAVMRLVAGRGLDALLVTSPENTYYLAGLSHQGYFAFTLLVLAVDRPPMLVTRSMETPTITKQAPDVLHVGFEDGEDPSQAALRALKEAGLGRARLGVELDHMFFPPAIWEALRSGLSTAEWVDASGLVEEVRLVKSPAELDVIRRAAGMSDTAVRAGIEAARAGAAEHEVAAEAYRAMLVAGSEYPGFAPLIRSTRTLAQEHSTWSDHVLAPGEVLFMELSASCGRYHAPLTRLVHLGTVPDRDRRASEVALEAHHAARSALLPGATAGHVYDTWQRVVDRAGGSGYRRHHCGYTVGIGFPPSWVGGSSVIGLRTGSPMTIRAGMVFHLMSWLIGSPLGDAVVSDTAVVTEGGAELLTCTERGVIVR